MTELIHNIEVWAEHLMGAWWIYPLLLGFSAFDAVVPALPSESLVIAAAIYNRANGEPLLLLVILFAAVGAILGDHLAYLIGRTFSGPAMRFMQGSDTRSRALGWARNGMAQRGGSLLVVARFIPGGRTALTMTMGATKHPLSHFTPWVCLAGFLWAIYAVAIGVSSTWLSRVIGIDVHENPLLAVGFGLVLAVGLTGLMELYRARKSRRQKRREAAASDVELP